MYLTKEIKEEIFAKKREKKKNGKDEEKIDLLK